MTKSFKLKESSVLFGQINEISSIWTETLRSEGLYISEDGEGGSGRVSARFKIG